MMYRSTVTIHIAIDNILVLFCSRIRTCFVDLKMFNFVVVGQDRERGGGGEEKSKHL